MRQAGTYFPITTFRRLISHTILTFFLQSQEVGGAVVPLVDDTSPETETKISPAFSVAGVEWLLTPFGHLESCTSRCGRTGKTCSDDQWPRTFGDFVSVVGATAPEDGRDSICAQVLQQDVSRHCAHSVVALSGRCYFQSMHRAPACGTEEDSSSDCQHFCPCV